jgi:5'-3' exonuclease
VDLHLVDATYELFRAYYAPRPAVLGRDGQNLSGVSGLVEQLLYLLRDQGATHVACATDQVIESFRNDLYPGYKSSAGMPPELLRQFPVAERAIAALGIPLWPMVEWEADDALAAAADRFDGADGVDRVVICSVDKDLAQCVRGGRVVLWDRRRDLVYDADGVRAKWGVSPESIPDYLALVGDASDGYPGIPGFGAKTAAALLSRYGHLEDVPVRGSAWEASGLRNPVALARTLVERLGEAMVYRDLARLRTIADGVVIPEQTPADLRWRGAHRTAWEAFCDDLGLARLRARPHRWSEG